MSTLWAFATLAAPPGAPLLDAAAAHTLRRLEHFGPADTSNSLWAYARLFHHPGADLLQARAAWPCWGVVEWRQERGRGGAHPGADLL